jgi:5-carboxymethyl-2-hydroxymuconate isomerase
MQRSARAGTNSVKLYLGLTESSAPHEARIFGECDGRLIDLRLAYAAYRAQDQGGWDGAYEFSAFYFPQSIAAFLARGQQSLDPMEQTLAFVCRHGASHMRGPAGEKISYGASELRILPPFQDPERSFVIGYSDKARAEGLPKAEIPTGYYKLPQTFITSGAPLIWPKFSREIDADACVAVVIGKAGKRISSEQAWAHVAGVTLLIDITARDINRREGATTNNLLGKNFPSSTSLGPCLLLARSPKELETLEVELSLDGAVQQKFTLAQCVFTVEQIIARWSILGLKPGDFFAIGASMALQSERLQNPVPLKPGSLLRCSAAGIGELTHRVLQAGATER